jgi:hypothetical protein
MKSGRICAIGTIFVFLIIAIPTFLCGCDSKIQPNCIKYFISDVSIINYKVESSRCSSCIYRSTKTNLCQAYHYYDCYYSYAIGSYYDTNDIKQTCDLSVDTGITNSQLALNNAMAEYPLNSTREMFVDKVSGGCFTKNKVRDLAIVGLTFFILTGLTALGWAIFEIRTWYSYTQTVISNPIRFNLEEVITEKISR